MSNKTALLTILGFVFVSVLGVVVIAAVLIRPQSAATPSRTTKTSIAVPSKDLQATHPEPSVVPVESAKHMVSIKYNWSKGGFDTVMLVDFTFTNRSPYEAKDITVTCTHYAPSGTQIDSNTRTIYEVIPAGGVKRIKAFNMGFIHSQASSTVCKIDDLVM